MLHRSRILVLLSLGFASCSVLRPSPTPQSLPEAGCLQRESPPARPFPEIVLVPVEGEAWSCISADEYVRLAAYLTALEGWQAEAVRRCGPPPPPAQ